MGHSASYRLLRRREEIVFRVGSTAMLVKRKTPNKGTTHRKPVVQRVQPLLKCVPSCRVRTLWMDGAQGSTLNVACSCTTTRPYHTARHPSAAARVTGAAPCTAHAPVRPNPAGGLASHICAAGLLQGHPHIARYHTITCQQLPTPQRESHHAAHPFDGLGSHTSLGGG
jgi:hypothetical protein